MDAGTVRDSLIGSFSARSRPAAADAGYDRNRDGDRSYHCPSHTWMDAAWLGTLPPARSAAHRQRRDLEFAVQAAREE
jgi:hypothetical protein